MDRTPEILHILALYTGNPVINDAKELLSVATTKHRSALIKLCQAQFVPSIHDMSSLAKQMKNVPNIRVLCQDGLYRSCRFIEAIQSLSPMTDDCIICGVVLDLARNYAYQDYQTLEQDSWGAEISLCETAGMAESNLDFRPWFDPQFFDKPVSDKLLPCRESSMFIFSSLLRWRRICEEQTHFPRATHKMMSYSTLRSYSSHFREEWDIPTRGIFSQVFWERIYFKYGLQLEGGLELRQSWTPAAVKPRTYYCQGGRVYSVARHLQGAFTALVNSMPVTHHLLRLKPGRLQCLDPEFIARVYDFSSFTSNLAVEKFFLRQLASFVSGHPFTKFDERDGQVTVDFGEVIDEYRLVAVECPEVSYERVTGDINLDSYHCRASALGVFGNINVCTFIHGAFELMINPDPDQVNVAGDDGLIFIHPDDMEDFDEVQQELGSYQQAKMFRSDEDGCICLKRPLIQQGTNLLLRPLVTFPTLPTLLFAIFKVKDPRLSYYETYSWMDRVSMVGNEILRCLRSFFWIKDALPAESLEWAIRFMNGLEATLESQLKITLRPSLPQCGGAYFWPQIPANVNEIQDPLPQLAKRVYGGAAWINWREEIDKVELRDFAEGGIFRCNVTPELSLLRRLAVVEVSAVKRWVYGAEGLELLEKSFVDPTPIVYEYNVRERIPPEYW